MKTYSKISESKKQFILELYFCSDDPRLKVISELSGNSVRTVSGIIQECFDGKTTFEGGRFIIRHSIINNFDK